MRKSWRLGRRIWKLDGTAQIMTEILYQWFESRYLHFKDFDCSSRSCLPLECKMNHSCSLCCKESHREFQCLKLPISFDSRVANRTGWLGRSQERGEKLPNSYDLAHLRHSVHGARRPPFEGTEWSHYSLTTKIANRESRPFHN